MSKFSIKNCKVVLKVKGGVVGEAGWWIAIQFGGHCAFKLMALWPTLELLLGSIVTTQVLRLLLFSQ